jgi:transposase
VQYLDKEIAHTKKQIKAQIAGHPELKQQSELLDSIKGIGERTIGTLLGEINFKQYRTARQVAAHVGLTPQNDRSGTIRGKTKLSKIGNARVRKALFMPALVAKRHNPIVRNFCARLAANGKSKMAIVGAVMRKLIHIAFGVLKSNRPFDPNHELEIA